MAAHAATQYAIDYPALARDWQNNSNYIVLLSVADRAELLDYYWKASSLTAVSLFSEPDIGDEETSFACILQPELHCLFSTLPLLLKGGEDGNQRV